MIRLRLLAWLFALAALVAPPAVTSPVASGAMDHAMAADCPDHAPPPCPDEGTAKHAAATCCPSMAGALALAMPVQPVMPVETSLPPDPFPSRVLRGRSPVADPPPPRT